LTQGIKKADVPMLPAQPANEAPAKTPIFKLTYSDGNEPQTFLLPEGERWQAGHKFVIW
jgi:hypothetical protein